MKRLKQVIALAVLAASLNGLVFLPFLALAANTAKFPLAVPGYSDLFEQKNRAATTLTSSLSAVATTINVTSTGDFPAKGLITIDNEIIATCAKTSTTFTVGRSACPNIDGRGFDTTIAATHSNSAVVQARVTAWHSNQTAAEVIAIATKLNYEFKSVRDYGATGDGITDDRAAIQAALDDSEFKCIYFPGGTYVHLGFLALLESHSCLLGGPNVVLSNTYSSTGGYHNDGIRIGNPSSRDDGTGTTFNISDVYVSGFNCDDQGRICIWGVYAQRVTVENITGKGVAVVAFGNDADDECEDIIVRNVTRTGPTTADWYTVGFFNTEHFILDGVISQYKIASQALPITNSRYGTVSNVTIDQIDSANDGIALLDSKYVTVTNFTVMNARKAIVVYSDFSPSGDELQYNSLGPGVLHDNEWGIHVYSRRNTFHDILVTDSGSQDLILGSDAQQNYFIGNVFRGGTLLDSSSVVNTQTWYANVGLRERIFIGNVGIGEADPQVDLHITGAVRARMILQGDYASGSTDVGGINFAAGVRTGSGTTKSFAQINGYNNSSANDTGGYIAFQTRETGSATLDARFYIRDRAGWQLNGGFAKPTCDGTVKGTYYYGAGSPGSPDVVQFCVKKTDDTYAWINVVTVP